MGDTRKEVPAMGARKLITISLPRQLLKKAEQVAEQENRTKAELVREAVRFYIDTSEVRKTAVREELFAIIDRVQERTRGVPFADIRRLVQEAVASARRTRRRASA
jgi:metal-responsive CopG/Arc/MetJ family transcriptional regulator